MCKKECVVDECTCMQHGMKCTDMCKLKECSNQSGEDDEDAPMFPNEVDDTDDECNEF